MQREPCRSLQEAMLYSQVQPPHRLFLQVINDVGAVHYGELTIIQPLDCRACRSFPASVVHHVIPCLPEAIHQ